MTNMFCVSKAQIIGRRHLLSGVNCQDALKIGNLEIDEEKILYGVICDGCSEGKDNEVGAKLATEYLSIQIANLVKSKEKLSKIPSVLHKRMISFMQNILNKIKPDSLNSRVEFIKNNLLFTIIGFILDKDQLMIFVQGDGVIIINNDIQIRDENDSPLYIGYELVDRKYLSVQASTLPTEFDMQIWDTSLIDRFAIASDSLGNELLVIPQIWDNPKPMSLQKKVNAWSWNDHMFKDDLSIIVVERNPEGG